MVSLSRRRGLPPLRGSASAPTKRRAWGPKCTIHLLVAALTLPTVIFWLSFSVLFHPRSQTTDITTDTTTDTITVDTTSDIEQKIKTRLQRQRNARRPPPRKNVPTAMDHTPVLTEDQIIFQPLDVDAVILDKIHKLVQEKPHLYTGKEQLLGMLLEMNLDIDAVDTDTWNQVPTWTDIQALHGKEPIIYGLDTCATFRKNVPAAQRRLGIAGMFNTGTNLLAILLQHNCGIPQRIAMEGRKRGHGMEWQVPWGKHTPEYIGRLHNYSAHTKRGANYAIMDPSQMMVVSMVRHPHDWINSMCRHAYTARWNHTKRNCPNLYHGNKVQAHFGAGNTQHDTIAHMWNDWNGAYYNATYPRLLIRFEDVVFYPKQLSRKICACVGGRLYPPKENDGIFHYVIDSAKVGPGHGPGKHRNGLVDAYSKYGTPTDFSALSKQDLDFMKKTFDQRIMKSLHWEAPR